MHISIHLVGQVQFNDQEAVRRIQEISTRVGVQITSARSKPNQFVIASLAHATIEIEARAINYFLHGTNRGELVSGIMPLTVRTRPCHFPFFHFYVGYNGVIMPCCHLRGDRVDHEHLRIGNLEEFDTIYEAFASQVASEWRRNLVGEGPKNSPCASCTAPFSQEIAPWFEKASSLMNE